VAVSTITGQVSDNTILADERVIDMDDVIKYLDPEVSQFTTMLQQVASADAFNSKVEWLEDELFPRLSAVVTGGNNVATTIVVTAGQGVYFRAGDLVRDSATGECVKVSSVATDTLTISRGIGAVAAATITAADQLVIIGNASMQGAGLGTRLVTKRVMQYNYCQIQRNPYGFVNTLRASKLYGGPEPDKERRKKAIEHKRALELTLFFGARGLDTTGTNPVGYSGGIIEYISTNVKDAGQAALTKANMDSYLKDILQHGSENKVMFAAPTVAMQLSGFLRDAWQPITTDMRLFGAKVDAWISGAYGYRLPVVVKRDWNDFATATKQYGGFAFIVDMDYVKLRPLRNTQLLRDRQANDSDSYDEEYLTEFTLEFQHERAHGLIKGVA
jgi:hypothetical protein